MNGAWPARSLCPEEHWHQKPVEHLLPAGRAKVSYNELTSATLDLLHCLLRDARGLMPRAASLYHAYHAVVEPLTGMVLAPITAGEFLMGSPDSEAERDPWEGPVHRVTLTSNFWMGIYPVTQRQYSAMTEQNPSHFQGDSRPVEDVDWEMAATFCRNLTERARTCGVVPPGYEFRLPTEAEWEYCCRAERGKGTPPPAVARRRKSDWGQPLHQVSVARLSPIGSGAARVPSPAGIARRAGSRAIGDNRSTK